MDNKKILTIFGIVILGVGAYLISTSTKNQTNIDVPVDFFAIEDTNAIDKIEIINATNEKNTFTLSERKWLLNNNYLVDKENISKFFLIFSKVQVKRAIAGTNAKELTEKLLKQGLKVNVFNKNKLLKAFIVDDGTFSNTTCFMAFGSNSPYFVEIPAFTDNFGHIFKIKTSNWASKKLFASSLRTLQSIEITQLPSLNILSIDYDKGFFKVQGVTKVDTNAIGNYLIQYRDIRFDDFVPDSLQMKFRPRLEKALYSIKVVDIDSLKNNKIKLVNFEEDPRLMIGAQEKSDKVFVISKQRLKNLIIDKASLAKR